MPSHSPLARLPTELIVSILGALPSLSDAAWFAATCRRHRQVWVDYAYTIYQQVAPRAIPCRKHARVLLSDQGGPPTSATLLAFHEVLQLVRNAAVIERSVADFESNHITRVREEYPVMKRHEPNLSPTERVRFIRGLYQLWSLLLLDSETRKQRSRSMKLRDLLVIRDFINGDAIYIPDPTVLALEGGDTMVAFANVYVDVYPQMEQITSELYGETMGSGYWFTPFSEGLRGGITVWDSYYEDVKDMLLKRRPGELCPAPEEVWYDTSDDDQIE